jgi:hypothetical protein
MTLRFSFSVAMDKFVIGRVVTAIDYPSIQFSKGRDRDCRRAPCKVPVFPRPERNAVYINTGTALTMLAELVLQGSPFLAALHNTRMLRSTGVRNWTFVSVRRK